MTGIDHETTEQVDIAARWLAEHWQDAHRRPVTAVLRERFGLGFNDAVRARVEAKRIMDGR